MFFVCVEKFAMFFAILKKVAKNVAIVFTRQKINGPSWKNEFHWGSCDTSSPHKIFSSTLKKIMPVKKIIFTVNRLRKNYAEVHDSAIQACFF